jgi:hypothetical protein
MVMAKYLCSLRLQSNWCIPAISGKFLAGEWEGRKEEREGEGKEGREGGKKTGERRREKVGSKLEK